MQIKRQRRSGRVNPDLIQKLGPIYQDLENRGEYVEALKVVEVAFEGLRYVKHPRAGFGFGFAPFPRTVCL